MTNSQGNTYSVINTQRNTGRKRLNGEQPTGADNLDTTSTQRAAERGGTDEGKERLQQRTSKLARDIYWAEMNYGVNADGSRYQRA